MARGDIKVVGNAAITNTFNFAVDDRTASTILATIKPGEPVEAGGTGNNFAILILNGEPVQASSTRLIGPAATESTETSTVDGYVDVHCVVPMCTILECRVTTAANVNLRSEWDDLQGDTVTLDAIAALTDSTSTTPYTIDEDEGDDPNDHGCVMVGWDINRPAVVQFVVKPLVTLFGNNL